MKRLIIIFTIFLSLVFTCCEKPEEDLKDISIKELSEAIDRMDSMKRERRKYLESACDSIIAEYQDLYDMCWCEYTEFSVEVYCGYINDTIE